MILLSLIILSLLGFLVALAGRRQHPDVAITSTIILSILNSIIAFSSYWLNAGTSVRVSWLLLRLDSLSYVMLCSVAIISLLIHTYSARYLRADKNQARFMAQLSLITAAINLFILSGSLLTAFVAWQFIGISLYLLLNHFHFNPAANKAAKKKFMINRLGDIAFLFAVLIAFNHYHSTDFTVLFQHSANTAILLLLIIAAMTKSAQFPFHIWLMDSVEAPTPVSAMMHAGVINAGGFLLARLSPWYNSQPFILCLLFFIGGTTALLGMQYQRRQIDIKRKLTFSTMGQMGFMVLQAGLGCFASAVFHLIAHGFLKGYLFLNSGSQLSTPPKKQQQNTIWFYVTRFALVAVLLLIGYNITTIGASITLSPLIWLMLFISLSTLALQCEKRSLLAIISIVFLSYCYLLKHFVLFIENSAIDSISLHPLTIAYLLAPVALMFFYLRTKQWRVEPIYRHYLLYPLRQIGDSLILLNNRMPIIARNTLFLTLVFGLFFTSLHISALPSLYHLKNSLIFINLTALIVSLIIANRVLRYQRLLMSFLLSFVTFANLGYLSAQHFHFNYIDLCLVNMTLLCLAFFSLTRNQQTQDTHDIETRQNRLSWHHIYFSAILILTIGIPGTASFIGEFKVLQQLMQEHFVLALMAGASMILLALVVLHTLQYQVFNPARKITHMRLPILNHIVCSTAIIINIISGIMASHIVIWLH